MRNEKIGWWTNQYGSVQLIQNPQSPGIPQVDKLITQTKTNGRQDGKRIDKGDTRQKNKKLNNRRKNQSRTCYSLKF